MGVAAEAKNMEAKDPPTLQLDKKKALSSFDQEP